jgi:hypothetical protein
MLFCRVLQPLIRCHGPHLQELVRKAIEVCKSSGHCTRMFWTSSGSVLAIVGTINAYHSLSLLRASATTWWSALGERVVAARDEDWKKLEAMSIGAEGYDRYLEEFMERCQQDLDVLQQELLSTHRGKSQLTSAGIGAGYGGTSPSTVRRYR